MGRQIAVQCASHGRLVFLYDNIRAVMEQAPARLERLAQDLAAKGLLGSSTSRETLRRIEPTTDMAAAAQAAIVIECVPEICSYFGDRALGDEYLFAGLIPIFA